MAKWLEARTCNLEAPSLSLLLTTSWICFGVVPCSNPRSRFVNSQLVSLPASGYVKQVQFCLFLKYLLDYMAPQAPCFKSYHV